MGIKYYSSLLLGLLNLLDVALGIDNNLLILMAFAIFKHSLYK